jgi:hypothetical protein
MMKQEQAKRLLIQEWDRWIKKQRTSAGEATGRESLKFFFELEDARSPLLDFRSKGGDKWLVIHAWLVAANRVK